MRVRWVLWFALVVCLSTVWISGVGAKEDAAYQKAMQLFEEARNLPPDDFIGKEILYRKAVTIYPEFAEAWNNLGNAYENLRQYGKARECYQRAIRIKPGLAAPYFGLGDIAFATGDYEEAKKWYEKGIALDPGDETAQKRLQLIESLLGKKTDLITAEEIVAAFSSMVTRGPGGVRSPSITFPEKTLPFDYNSAEIRPDARAQLNEIGKALSSPQLAQAVFEIAGHTCDLGSEGYNLVLSTKRAENVRKYLIENFAIAPYRLAAVGYGETSPLVPNTSEENRRINRRVEIRKIAERAEKPAANASEFSVKVDFLYLEGNRKVPMRQNMILTGDDNYQIFFRASHDCYVYILQVDSQNRIFQLFPNPEYTPYTNPVKAGKDYWIPDKDLYFFLDEVQGEETIYFFASRNRPVDVEEAIALSLQGESAPLKERLVLRGVGGSRQASPRVSTAEPPLSGGDYFYLVFSFYNSTAEAQPFSVPSPQPEPSQESVEILPSPSPEVVPSPSPSPRAVPSPSPSPKVVPSPSPSPEPLPPDFPDLPPGVATPVDFSPEVFG